LQEEDRILRQDQFSPESYQSQSISTKLTISLLKEQVVRPILLRLTCGPLQCGNGRAAHIAFSVATRLTSPFLPAFRNTEQTKPSSPTSLLSDNFWVSSSNSNRRRFLVKLPGNTCHRIVFDILRLIRGCRTTRTRLFIMAQEERIVVTTRKYRWPDVFQMWNTMMIIFSAAIMGIFASFITVQNRLQLRVPW
jgi:hypothetical protein